MGIILFLVFGAVNAMIAKSKGYNGALWFFVAGLLGFIILLFLPNTNNKEYDEDKAEELRKRGNNIGAGILIVGVTLLIFLFIAISSQ